MKIAHITWTLSTGGIETMLVNIVNEQVKTHSVCVCIINDLIDVNLVKRIDSKVKFISIGRKLKSKNILPIFRLNFKLLIGHFDIIHLHSHNIVPYIFPIFKNKCRITQHNVSVQKFNKKYFRRVKKIFSVSQAVKDFLLEKQIESTVVFNGISIQSIKQKTEFSKDGLKIVQVARLDHHNKGQNVALQALPYLVVKGIKNISLDFIGEGSSLDYLKGLTAELSLNQYVNFLGNKSQTYIFEHLCDYDLSLALSSHEAFGLTVAEAMAAKVPVLASDIPAFREVLDNGQLGILTKEGNPEDTANRIAEFLEKGADEQMIDAAYERIKSLYSVETTAMRYLEEYKKI